MNDYESGDLAARVLRQNSLFKTLRIVLPHLASDSDLSRRRTAPLVAEQLRRQAARIAADRFRYEVTIKIVEGRERPATDIDNYAKRVIDGITQSRLLWRDDDQIDKLRVFRRRQPRSPDTQVTVLVRRIAGQHLGVPTFFRACCQEARRGGQFTYAHPGYHLAIHLWSQQPYDADVDHWAKELDRLITSLDNEDGDGVWNWFLERYPKCMRLVPARRKEQFVAGVREAYEKRDFSP